MKSHTKIRNLSDSVLQIRLEELRAVEKSTTFEILLYLLEVEVLQAVTSLSLDRVKTYVARYRPAVVRKEWIY